MNKQGFLFVFLMSAAILWSQGVHAQEAAQSQSQIQQSQLSEQAKVIQEFNEALIAAMKGGKELGYEGRYKLLEPVIDKTFAMSYMASRSLGRYWKPLSDADKKAFLDLYRQWSIAQYAENFDEYDNQSFKIVSESESARGLFTVNTDFTKPIGDIIEFNYQLRKIKDHWRIVDIFISGVSQLANTRSQFMTIMKKQGLEGLSAEMKQKIEMFSSKKD